MRQVRQSTNEGGFRTGEEIGEYPFGAAGVDFQRCSTGYCRLLGHRHKHTLRHDRLRLCRNPQAGSAPRDGHIARARKQWVRRQCRCRRGLVRAARPVRRCSRTGADDDRPTPGRVSTSRAGQCGVVAVHERQLQCEPRNPDRASLAGSGTRAPGAATRVAPSGRHGDLGPHIAGILVDGLFSGDPGYRSTVVPGDRRFRARAGTRDS